MCVQTSRRYTSFKIQYAYKEIRMTFNEWVYFICGIYLGGWLVRPIVDIVKTVWKNAKEASDGNNR